MNKINELLALQVELEVAQKELSELEGRIKDAQSKVKVAKAATHSVCAELDEWGGDVIFHCEGKKYIKHFGNNWPYWLLVEPKEIGEENDQLRTARASGGEPASQGEVR